MTTIISSTKGTQTGPSAYWRQRLAVQPSSSLQIKKQQYALSTTKHGVTVYLASDVLIVDDHSDWYTTEIADAQIYYDQEVAFGKAGILSSLIDASVEVVLIER